MLQALRDSRFLTPLACVSGLAVAVLVTWLARLLPFPPPVLNSTIPWEIGGAVGVLSGLALASLRHRGLRPLLVLLGIAFVVAAIFVDGALLLVSQNVVELNEKGRCGHGYYPRGELCAANGLSRIHFARWIPAVASLGLATWLSAFVVERLRGRRTQTFTAVLLGLALAAGTLQNAERLDRSLSFEGDRVRAWNVFHYYLGSKYYKELGHQDLYAAVLAADDDYQAWAIERGGKKQERRLKRSWRRIEEARDLRSYTVLPRDELVEGFDRSRFTPERLKELGRDSRFFERFQGWGNPGWRQCFKDLGFNPAPPWTVVGTPLANLVPTKWPWFWVVSNSDLPFYLLAFGLIWWAFGLRTAAVMTLWLNCAQLNEARFTGGFLQYDWLVSCLATIALYRRGWYRASGVALSWAAMTRVFPGFLLLPIGLKILGSILGIDAAPPREGRGPLHRGFLGRIHRSHWNFTLSFTVACAVLFGASTLTGRGLQNWADWFEKIDQHSTTHPVTSNQRIGVGRLAVHTPRTVKSLEEQGKTGAARRLSEVSLWERMTAPANKHRFWSSTTGRDKLEMVEKSVPRRRMLQLLALPFLLLALVRRRDLDGMILMLFGVFLMVTISRYYASTWAMLFALGAASSTVPPVKRLIPLPALFIGGVLLLINSLFYLPGRVTTSYYLINYLMYGSFLLLCSGYIVSDVRALLAKRRAGKSDPEISAEAEPELEAEPSD